MEDFEDIEFVIPAYTPETMPLDRLLQYLKEVGDVVGLAHDMHLVRIETSSTRPVFRMPVSVARQARETGASVQRGDGTTRQRAAYQRIRQMVERDSGAKPASLSDKRGVILDFPPLKQEGEISGLRQVTSVDGILLRAGGASEFGSLLLQGLKGEQLAGFTASRTLTKEMARHLYEPVRVHGVGIWDRTLEGQWTLGKMAVQSYELLGGETLEQVVRELQAVALTWPDDAAEQLRSERERV